MTVSEDCLPDSAGLAFTTRYLPIGSSHSIIISEHLNLVPDDFTGDSNGCQPVPEGNLPVPEHFRPMSEDFLLVTDSRWRRSFLR